VTTPPKRTRGRPRAAEVDTQGGTVQSLDRGLMVLGALARREAATLTELTSSMGMPASSAHRILKTLQTHGFADFDDATQEWTVGVEAFRVGSAFLRRTNLVEASRGALHRLMIDTGETANLAIADEGDVVFLSQVETHNPIRAFFRPGTRGPMHASGIGKALLAELPRHAVEAIAREKGLPRFTAKTLTTPERLTQDLEATRARGWSLDDEERHDGMRCVAAAIHNGFGEAIAGISISGPAVRFPDDGLDTLGARIRDAAREVTRLIGGGGASV